MAKVTFGISGQTLPATFMKTILDGGLYYESPRWHAGRLRFVDCWTRTLRSVPLAGGVREHATRLPCAERAQ